MHPDDRQGAADLEAARSGDPSAFERLVGPYRRELHAHCYRMLGSLHDADDALQEALVRAWRGLGRFEDRSLRGWLHTIASNCCLTMIESRRRRELPADLSPGAPLTEGPWLEPYPGHWASVRHGTAPEPAYERRESIELAFVAALQRLPPGQRAALVLREVLGFSARETAAALDTTVASVNSALQRARRTVAELSPARSQEQALRTLGDDRLRVLVDRYVRAWEAGDVDAIVELLAADARYSMPPLPQWYEGRESIATFLREGPITSRWRFLPTWANGQPAFGTYLEEPEDSGRFVACALDVVMVDGEAIQEVVSFLTPEIFDRWGLPLTVGRDQV